jgi:hypothetical protein
LPWSSMRTLSVVQNWLPPLVPLPGTSSP